MTKFGISVRVRFLGATHFGFSLNDIYMQKKNGALEAFDSAYKTALVQWRGAAL